MYWLDQILPKTVKYVIKTDDDAFLNIFAWIKLADKFTIRHETNHTYPFIIGTAVLDKSRPIRHKHKNALSFAEFPYDVFPPYAVGCGYLLSRAAVTALVQNYKTVTPIKIEDVFFTGILAKQSDVSLYGAGFATLYNRPRRGPFLVLHYVPPEESVWSGLWRIIRIRHGIPSTRMTWPDNVKLKRYF